MQVTVSLLNIKEIDVSEQRHYDEAPGKVRTKKNLLFQAGFLNMVGERGLRFSARSALRAVAKATLSRYARLKPPSEVLILIN